ncbi:helix-turn-helix domain-containing protein [Citrobacter sp. FDAARGOS_156]|uniref:helix-turn-helix transcriptional regulator n=1 Tax=Citrobacter sp. FDAARGOS_156 TaxID=1702170 RepID=UPI001907E0F7|nr:helix-turn-helix domain-containing protein [Citrobacter sp. FDAARGOS_156]MBJ9642652.1 helix-turn-helix domain-containing protein [Citrobacter sp. FDAARGOS_156]
MYLTIKQFAEIFNLSASTVASDISRNPGKLPPFIRIGRAIRFSLDDIVEWENAHRQNKLKGDINGY